MTDAYLQSILFVILFYRLYKELGEFDVLQGIFGKHIGSHDITHTALQAEARGDYATAVKLYNQVNF